MKKQKASRPEVISNASCLTSQVLETCVKNCGHRFHILVASQDFVEGVLVRTILPKNNPPAIVHDKVLTLIQVSASLSIFLSFRGPSMYHNGYFA